VALRRRDQGDDPKHAVAALVTAVGVLTFVSRRGRDLLAPAFDLRRQSQAPIETGEKAARRRRGSRRPRWGGQVARATWRGVGPAK
jgi:hypothetical protein